MIEDAWERLRALDPEASFIVQAPAGSGKTELLIQRFLKLLARVDGPESVVAITFTKKAAGEMRARVNEALRAAAAGEAPVSEHRAATLGLASDAMARDREKGWGLLDNPARLRIQTIDSLSVAITSRMPWLARFGAPPAITEKARPHYREAARNTLRMAADEERGGCRGPLSRMLLHLDNDFGKAEGLIADMLEKRDQWLRLTGPGGDLGDVRPRLEQTLGEWIGRELGPVRAMLPEDAMRDIVWLLELDSPLGSSAGDLGDWVRFTDLVLTKSGTARKQAPPDTPKDRWARLRSALPLSDPGFVDALKGVRKLPAEPRYSDDQWEAMEAFVEVLPRAVAHLKLVFREHGKADFAELTLQALHALGQLDSPTDLALSFGFRIEHLLVDEFQDTSYTHFDLLRRLTSGWEAGDGRTLFLVGDPMQSIYRFREADVSLFLKARREGIGHIALESLTLRVNFRSDAELVGWVNQTFGRVMPSHENATRGAVAYSASVARRPAGGLGGPVVHAFLDDARESEAETVVRLVEEAGGSTAILVRARSHLGTVAAALRRRGIRFQAIEIDELGGRPIIQDLMALTFALLHFGDRISWLTVLRAPWCGLLLADLVVVAGDGKAAIWDRVRGGLAGLSEDGRARLARCVPIWDDALGRRGRVGLRTLVEYCWVRLGGPACVAAPADLGDAGAYFDLLESLEEGGDLADFEELREQVKELFAQPDSEADGRLQVMTIHKAKGLEFDTVILPGLGLRSGKEDDQLLIWQEQEGELLLAAMSATGGDKDPVYQYLRHIEKEKIEFESARLLYVAVTRARDRLHLLGCGQTVEAPKEGQEAVSASKGSFLKMLWEEIGHHFLGATASGSMGWERAGGARMLRRLPAGWAAPRGRAGVTWVGESTAAVEAEEVTYEWAGDLLRHAGTVLHAFLQRIAKEGVERWDEARVGASSAAIRSLLGGLGVPPVDLAEGVGRVEQALVRTLADERGRWVLGRRAEAESEWRITGVLDGKVVQGVIDRTFVDEQGVRWIIDYKSGTHEGGSLENFLESERRRYQDQLEKYSRLIAQADERPIRLGLYFPLLGAWVEWAAPALKRRQASLFD